MAALSIARDDELWLKVRKALDLIEKGEAARVDVSSQISVYKVGNVIRIDCKQ